MSISVDDSIKKEKSEPIQERRKEEQENQPFP